MPKKLVITITPARFFLVSIRSPGFDWHEQPFAFSTLAKAKSFALAYACNKIRNRDDKHSLTPDQVTFDWQGRASFRLWAIVHLTKPGHPLSALEFVIVPFVVDVGTRLFQGN